MPLTERCIQLTLGALPFARLSNTKLAACSLMLVLGSLPVVTAAQSLSSDQGQPRPPGDNLADARSTMLRHDAADRQDSKASRSKRVEEGVRDNVGRGHGQDDAVPRMPLRTSTMAASIGPGCKSCGLFDRCQIKCMSIACEYIYGGGLVRHSCLSPNF